MRPPKWYASSIDYNYTGTGICFTIRTDRPCHCWLRWSNFEPTEELVPIYERGIFLYCQKKYHFPVYYDVEQTEDDDTVYHTFFVEPWPFCVRKWFYFLGKVGGIDSPSTSAIFTRHHKGLPPYNEFYPNKCPGVTTVDGWCRMQNGPLTWTQMRNGPGQVAYPCAGSIIADFVATGLPNLYSWMTRSILLFDTSAIPPSHFIIAATLDIYLDYKFDTRDLYPRYAIYHSTPNSNTTLIASDYTKLGTIPLSQILSYSQLTVGQYNSFPFNQLGIDHITPGDIVKLGLREAKYDAPNNPPTWQPDAYCRFWGRSADHSTGPYPRLTIWHKSP